jgi:hypothetical protein
VKKSKEIYEHLAEVYLDSSRNKNKNHPNNKSLFRNPFKVGIGVVVCFVFVLTVIIFARKSAPHKSQLALVLEDDTRKIDYDFNNTKKKVAIYDLRNMNLLGFKSLGFRLRKGNYQDNLHMRVEFISNFGEESGIYIKQIPTRWQNYTVELTEFKDISDWVRMRQLLFVLEEWNAQAKKGNVYIDNVQFLK